MKEFAKTLLRRFFIMGALKRPIIPFRINLLYVSNSFVKKGKAYYNVGDYLSKVVFEMLMKHFGIKSYWTGRTCCVAHIGSIIQFIGQDCVVYGSGFLFRWAMPQFARKKLKFDIRAVRGPLTRDILMELGYNVPKVYGDPAILLPLLYPFKKECLKVYPFTVIPHESHIELYKNAPYHVLSTLTNDWEYFIHEIWKSEFVISSSLHGIIIAEAYGIPAIFLNETENPDQLKYDDYYYSTGRKQYVKGKTVEECLKFTPEKIPDFKEMQDDLLKSFPMDVFRKRRPERQNV